MEERIRQRIAELEALQEQTIGRLNAIAGALAELRALLVPDQPIMSGDPLGERPEASNGVEAHLP